MLTLDIASWRLNHRHLDSLFNSLFLLRTNKASKLYITNLLCGESTVVHHKGPVITLQWRHNEPHGAENHWHLDCLLNRLSRRKSKKTSKLRVTGLCEGNPPVDSPHKGPVTRKLFPFVDVCSRRKTFPCHDVIMGHLFDYYIRNRGSLNTMPIYDSVRNFHLNITRLWE